MEARIYSSREFNQNASAVRKASESGPVVIAVRGVPKSVMLNYSDYQKLAGKTRRRTLYEAFSMPGFEKMDTTIDLEDFIPRQNGTAAEFD